MLEIDNEEDWQYEFHDKLYWAFEVEDNCLRACAPKDKEMLFCVLHELGHIQNNEPSRAYPKILNLDEIVSWEVKAWGYVFRCIKKQFHSEVFEIATKYLETYLTYYNKSWAYD